jgi:hypothetical protein
MSSSKDKNSSKNKNSSKGKGKKDKPKRRTLDVSIPIAPSRFLMVDGVRLSLPTAKLQNRMSRLHNLDDAWALQEFWEHEYYAHNGFLPPDRDEAFRKVMLECRRRILASRRS